MKNKIIEINETTLGIEIKYKDKILISTIDKEDLEKISFIKGT